jgi:hypothetical protein
MILVTDGAGYGHEAGFAAPEESVRRRVTQFLDWEDRYL